MEIGKNTWEIAGVFKGASFDVVDNFKAIILFLIINEKNMILIYFPFIR